ncbi:hypothetical protein QTG54_014782 [Skeletonema marinoi]|uniref:SAM domain-containing protein n=1 Tax=Skeletonema marinoi TaxID=267567 RepID=A0AAD9D6A2_9STRA|nr:hypothetical protein QTG54_014782 [Skeletonema marinoi]
MPSTSSNTAAPCWKKQHQQNMEQRRKGLDAASISRADGMATECRNRLMDSIKKISSQSSSGGRKLGLFLSGGVDSSAILQAAALIVIIDPSDEENDTSRRSPDDELYAIEAARLYNDSVSDTCKMKHSIMKLSPAHLIKEYSRPTIKTLALWGYMETRNSLIISAALHEADKLGITDIIVGDNADELFGGSYDCYFHEKYSNDHEAWKEKRNSMAELPFVTQKLATEYGITVHQPFTDQDIFVQWALNETSRDDCVTTDKCELQSHFGGPYEIQNCGKLPLREAFCTVASWRRMDWIFRGSGASDGDILVDHYNTSIGISDDEFQSEQAEYLAEKGVKLKSKEHLHNIRIFQEVFGGLVHPTKERYPIGDPRGCLEEKKTECAATNGDVDVSDDDLIDVNAGGRIIAARRGVLCQLKGTIGSEEGKERNTSPVEISDAIDSKWTALKDLDAEIISLENSFTDEEKFITSIVGGSTSDIVTLNVSGTVMATKRDTLLVIKEVANWAKKISNIQEDVSNLFQENDINGAELLALNEFGLEKVGVKRAGTICLLLKEIKQLEKASQDVVTLIEHSPYCFGKILDFLRMKQVGSLELCGNPALPSVCEHNRDMFEKVVKYYIPGESSKRILG